MSTPRKETVLTLATKLGIVVAGAAVGATVISTIPGDAAWEFIKSSTSRLSRRPVPPGEPNYDLNKALAGVIATAITTPTFYLAISLEIRGLCW